MLEQRKNNKIKLYVISQNISSETKTNPNINISISISIYIIAEAERKWIPTIKEVVTNRIKCPFVSAFRG